MGEPSGFTKRGRPEDTHICSCTSGLLLCDVLRNFGALPAKLLLDEDF